MLFMEIIFESRKEEIQHVKKQNIKYDIKFLVEMHEWIYVRTKRIESVFFF